MQKSNLYLKPLDDDSRYFEREEYRLTKQHPQFQPKRRPTIDFGFTNEFILFNRMIGNPISKLTNVQQDMAPFQEHYHDVIQEHHTMEFLKSRKLGATETWNRSCALNCFDRYKGHDVMIIAGNEVRIANEILIRFDELFRDTYHEDGLYAFKYIDPVDLDNGWTWQEAQQRGQKIYHDEIIRKANFGQNPTVEFYNDTRVMAFAASRQEKAQSFRGTDDVIAAFLSEAAHTGMKTDQPIMTALEPNLAQRDDGDLVLETTGNGRRGFFFEYWKETMRIIGQHYKIQVTEHQILVNKLNADWMAGRKIPLIDWWPIMYDYKIGLKHNILSQKYIDKQRRNPKLDFDQEYCCKFTSTYTQAIKTEDLTFKDTTGKEYKKSIDLLGPQGIDKDYGNVGYRG